MSIVHLARPEIQALTAYQAAEQVDDTVRLNANESPHVNPVGKFRRPLNRYPEIRPLGLQARLAGRFDCRTDQLLVTRGSSEAIDLIIRAFCRAGTDNVVVPSPSFSMYSHYAAVQGAEVIDVSPADSQDFRIDIDAVLAACTASTRVVFVCSPNNPTGTSVSRSEILKLLKDRNGKAAVVIDEAYIEFSQQSSVVDLLDDYPNLLILRTLSKALGFAGARCGAVLGEPAVLDLLSAIQAPYALSTPVVECVEDALQSNQLTAAGNAIQVILDERERLAKALERFAFVDKVWPSDTNFLLIRVRDADRIMLACASKKLLLRHFGGVLADCIRITVGTPDDNDRLLRILGAEESG